MLRCAHTFVWMCCLPVATHEQLVSKAFQGRHGRAFLFTTAANFVLGPKEERALMTGLHAVADIYCTACNSRLGWKYIEAFESRCVRWLHVGGIHMADLWERVQRDA